MMSILYLLTSPEPVVEGTDAVFQEVQALQTAFSGERVNLFPLKSPSSLVPRYLYGFHQIRTIKHQEKKLKLNHTFSSTLYYFPVLRYMQHPIIYTIIASLQGQRRPTHIDTIKSLSHIVVSSERDQHILESWGMHHYSMIRPGIDTSGLFPHPLPIRNELTLLMASAPWEKAQFRSKGIDLLLEATVKPPFLKLILLWRGLLFEKLRKKINDYGITKRVEVINQKVNISDFLKRSHAAILISKYSNIVKAYPNSLIESLSTGKPSIVSDNIPIADYVTQKGCGIVVENFDIHSLIHSIHRLVENYHHLADHVTHTIDKDFSLNHMIEQYRRLYHSSMS